jgi:RNA polymerase sigma-70 factor, ECF subfamily
MARVATSDTSIDPLGAAGSCPRPTAPRFPRAPSKTPVSPHRADLVEALKGTARGDKAAFEKVYASTAAKLFGIVVRILGRRDLAEDVMQDVYVRVWQRAGDFDPQTGSPITWLATIARNRALDETRRKTTRSLEDCPEILLLPSEDDPRVDHERSEERTRLQACLDGLAKRKTATRHACVRLWHDAGGTRARHGPARGNSQDMVAAQPRAAQGLPPT